jgi:hypothetical protein
LRVAPGKIIIILTDGGDEHDQASRSQKRTSCRIP